MYVRSIQLVQMQYTWYENHRKSQNKSSKSNCLTRLLVSLKQIIVINLINQPLSLLIHDTVVPQFALFPDQVFLSL